MTTARRAKKAAESDAEAPAALLVCGAQGATFRGGQTHPESLCECEQPLGHGGPHVCRVDHETWF